MRNSQQVKLVASSTGSTSSLSTQEKALASVSVSVMHHGLPSIYYNQIELKELIDALPFISASSGINDVLEEHIATIKAQILAVEKYQAKIHLKYFYKTFMQHLNKLKELLANVLGHAKMIGYYEK